MRNALVARNNGASPLPQVVVLVLLQAVVGHASLTYHRSETRAPLLARDVTPEGEKAKIVASSATSSFAANDRTPHVRALGFFSRGYVLRTPDELRRMLPRILNRTEAGRKLDTGQWSRDNGRQGDTGVSPLSTSSHFGIPHLVRLGFGAVNSKPGFSYPPGGGTGSIVRDQYVQTTNATRHVVVLGVGSFLGAMFVFLLIFSLLLLRRRRKQRLLAAERRPSSKVGESKWSLLRHEILPAVDDVSNELSTASCSSASSHTSDTSHDSDTWRHPDHIGLSSFDGDQQDDGSRRRTERSGTNPRDEMPASSLLTHDNVESRQSSDPGEPSPCCRSVPDLLLPNERPNATRHGVDVYSCTKSFCQDGGIVSCAGGDVVLIIPPGSLDGECRVRIRASTGSSCDGIRETAPGELVLSPVIDIKVSRTEFFRRPITLKFPYRSLCTCVSGVLALRCWDHSSSATWIPTDRTLRDGVINHYTWPDCFSPEPGVPDRDGCLCTRQATYSCFSNVCTIETNVPGTFCLTSPSRDHADCCRDARRLSAISESHRDNNIRLCMAIGAKCHLDYRKSDDVSSQAYVRQINYTICLSDNTASGRQEIEEFIQTSGGRLQCACVPLDVAMGSEVKVTLGSVCDPEWPWEIPFDSTSKVIRWQDFCKDYSTLVRVEFRCLSRSDDLLTFTPNDVNIVSIFQVETEQHTATGLDTIRMNIVADNGYC